MIDIKSRRIVWIDIMKGLGIILVLLGHAPRDIMRESFPFINYIYQFIYSFHMGLFFFISGYIYYAYETHKKRNFVRKKICSLLVPWIIFSLFIFLCFKICLLFSNLQLNDFNNISFFRYLYLCILGKNPVAFHLWFLEVMFIVQTIIFIFDKLFNINCQKKYFLMLILIIISIFFKNIFLINMITKYTFFYILGIIYGEQMRIISLKILNKNNLILALSLLIMLCVYFESDLINIYILNLLKYIKIYIFAPLLIFQIANKIKNGEQNRFIEYLGKNSFNIYLLHQPFCCAFLGEILLKVLSHSIFNYIFIMIICFSISILFPLLLTFLLYKTHLEKIVYKFLKIRYISFNSKG